MKKIVDELYRLVIESLNLTYVKFSAILTPLLLTFNADFSVILSSISAYFIPLVILAFIDVITGMIAARFFENKPITSDRFWFKKTIVSILFFLGLISIIVLSIFLKEMGESISSMIPKSWMIFYGCYEGISILENIARMKVLPGITGFIAFVKEKLPDFYQKIVDKEKDKNDPPTPPTT